MDKYIVKHFINKFFITIFTFVIIFILIDLIDHLDDIIDSEMPSIDILIYYLHSFPWYTSIALPMALLLSTVFTLSILQKNNEICALKSSGISIKRLSTSILIIGMCLSIFSFYFDNLYVINHLQKRNDLGIKYKLIRSSSNSIKKKNILQQESTHTILGIKQFKFRSNTAHNVSIQEFNKGNIIRRLDATLMKWDPKNNFWSIKNYETRNWNKNNLLFNKIEKDSILNLNFTPMDLTQATVKPEEMNYWELKQFVKKLDDFGVKDPRWAVNMHFKTAFACTSFLMVLFGLSLSISKPRGNLTVGIGISILVIFLYYAGIKMGQSLGYKGTLDPAMSVWLPNIIFFISGLYFFSKTKT
tara:strand:+ start:594 stop:1667 length:1074 start_codon:yes stop_codon:yes gene_type:complete